MKLHRIGGCSEKLRYTVHMGLPHKWQSLTSLSYWKQSQEMMRLLPCAMKRALFRSQDAGP